MKQARHHVQLAMNALAHFWDDDAPCDCPNCFLWRCLRDIKYEMDEILEGK